MSIIIGSARIDERGKLTGGKAGDQKQTSSTNDTKGEVSMQNFYVHSKGWRVLRPKSISHANKIASNMKQACNNPNIGYDQNQRLGVVSNGTDSKVKTEADCSALVRACVQEATGKKIANFTTVNEEKVLEGTGLFEDAFSFVSQSKTPIYNGDVLVTKTKGHTVIVVSGNARSSADNSTYYEKYTGTSSAIDTVFKKIGVPEKFCGKWSKRKPVASANGISNYTGKSTQNLQLINLAKKGKLKKV